MKQLLKLRLFQLGLILVALIVIALPFGVFFSMLNLTNDYLATSTATVIFLYLMCKEINNQSKQYLKNGK